MTSEARLVQLTTANTAIEAEWLVGALKGFDVVAVTFGGGLADEFAMSQKVMGLGGGVRVMVLEGDLERAQTALQEIEKVRPTEEEMDASMEAAVGAVEHEEQADDSPTPQRGGGKNAAIVFLMAAVIALGLVALHQYEQLTAWKQASPLTESTWNGDRWESRWRHNNQLDSIALDEDGNGVSETVWIYDREGTLVGVSYDANQNGVTELSINLDPEGKERVRLIDANENLITERYEYPARDGVREIWLDADEDERYERYEFVDAETGEVLDAFADRGREGYVRVK